MTGPEPDDQYDDIRRLLADARHTEAMPADVVARMDDVLADLSASRPAGDVRVDAPATVISLAAHRRRRAGGLLVAAAAIVVAGIAVTQHLPTRAGTSSAATSATDRSASEAGGQAPGTPSAHAAQPSAEANSPKLAGGRVVVHASSFPADATAAQRLTERSYAADRTASPAPVTPGCVATPAHSRIVPATFHGAPAALVFLRPEGDTQVVDLYLCGQPQPIRSVTLPAP